MPVRLLFVASEVAPFSKTGGLADVSAALPACLEAIGHEVMVVSPLYTPAALAPHRLHPVYQDLSGGPLDLRFGAYLAEDGRNWQVDYPPFYHRGSIYTNDPDEHRRFLLLTWAAIELCRRRAWSPDVAHANDWQTGLLPLYLRSSLSADPILGSTRSVFTIHNLGYQGSFPASIVNDLGLGDQQYLLHQEHLRRGRVNFLEHALLYADVITTVSPTYAWEIQTPERGFGLDGLLRRRSHDLVGILNGIDTAVWNPRTDRHLVSQYSDHTLGDKHPNKLALMARRGLDNRADLLLVGTVTRLTGQKGIELMIRPLARLLAEDRIRFVALGSGEPRYEEALRWLADSFPGRASYQQGYDEPLAHLIEGGADAFLMPSQYEPSGLNQMYSLAYGTAPVVRRTGGLADTVTHYDPDTGEGNGFVFEHYTEQGLWWALEQALGLFPDREAWRRMQRNGMMEDNSWERRGRQYDEVYRRLIGEG